MHTIVQKTILESEKKCNFFLKTIFPYFSLRNTLLETLTWWNENWVLRTLMWGNIYLTYSYMGNSQEGHREVCNIFTLLQAAFIHTRTYVCSMSNAFAYKGLGVRMNR